MEEYEVVQLIGSGSFGKVFMGRKRSNNKIVALKKISKGGRSDREIKSLRQECEIQKNLHHPNIIQMLDSFETDDSVVVVTEYAQGDLCKLLLREGRLVPQEVERIACHIVSALYFLHSHRTLHRDIKPQNILIGWDGIAKLCDFGFARTMGINTYMLTSIKGTPLYMAPEIVQEKPYDHNADLWSLGCILYELLVGTPPFFTTSLFQLVCKIKSEAITWPEDITGDCLSFLQGLLEKNPQKRLTWPDLLNHPFVREGVYVDKTVEEFSLTKALSPSQELEKEKQRLLLQKKLTGYSKLLVKTARRLEETQKKLKRCSEEEKSGVKTPLASPNGVANKVAGPGQSVAQPYVYQHIGVPPQHPLKISPNLPSPPDVKNLRVMFQNQTLNEGPLYRKGNQSSPQQGLDARLRPEVNTEGNSASSYETMSSSSESEDSDETGGAHAVFMETNRRREAKKRDVSAAATDNENANNNDAAGLPSSRGGSGLLWKSGALFMLHSFGSEDKPINSDEWINFIKDTMKEVLENPKTLCEKHFLTMLVTPLRNHLAEPEVVEQIAKLLSIPFTLDTSINETEPGLMVNLQNLYLDTKVLPNLLYACKLIVRRRRLEHGSVTFGDIPKILTPEDLEGLDKCLVMVTCLVYEDEDFLAQFCDSVCLLQAFAILQLFLKLDNFRSELASNTVAILCHILRVFPSNYSIVEEILLDESDSNTPEAHSELWRLLSHQNPTIKARTLRLLTLFCLNSDRARTEIFIKHRSRIWKILRRSLLSSDLDIRQTAEFSIQALKYKWFPSEKSSSLLNSGCQSQSNAMQGPSLPAESQEERMDESLEATKGESPVDPTAEFGPTPGSSANSGPADDPSR